MISKNWKSHEIDLLYFNQCYYLALAKLLKIVKNVDICKRALYFSQKDLFHLKQFLKPNCQFMLHNIFTYLCFRKVIIIFESTYLYQMVNIMKMKGPSQRSQLFVNQYRFLIFHSLLVWMKQCSQTEKFSQK